MNLIEAKRQPMPLTMPDRLPPHDIESEQFVIGCCIEAAHHKGITDPQEVSAILAQVPNGSMDFYDARHQIIFKAVHDLVHSGIVPDVALTAQKLGKQLEAVGGAAYLVHLADLVFSHVNLAHHLEVIRTKSELRRVIKTCTEAIAMAHEDAGGSSLDRIEASLSAIDRKHSAPAVLTGVEASHCLISHIEERHALNGRLAGIATGFGYLDRMIDGLQAGEQCVIGARPSQGKTAIGLNIVESACLRGGIPTLVFSLEMSPKAIYRRLLSSWGSIPLKVLKTGQLNEAQFKTATRFGVTLKNAPLHVVNGLHGISSTRIASIIRSYTRKHGIRLVLVDYLQKVKPAEKSEKRTYEVAEVSQTLKATADRCNVAMVTLAQLNRESDKDKGRAPKLSDMGDSGQIERDADLALLIHRPRTEADPNGTATSLIVAKQRDGETGIAPLHFNGEFCRFEERRQFDNISHSQPPEE